MGTTCLCVGRGRSGGALGDVSGLEAKEEVEEMARWRRLHSLQRFCDGIDPCRPWTHDRLRTASDCSLCVREAMASQPYCKPL